VRRTGPRPLASPRRRPVHLGAPLRAARRALDVADVRNPDVNYAWGFEALAWPFWKLGGVIGLFAWRWLTTLTAFLLAFSAARALGARNLVPIPVAVLCAMVFRSHTLVRPEGVATLLVAAELAWLAARVAGQRAPAWMMIAIAWVWANTHITYYWFLLA